MNPKGIIAYYSTKRVKTINEQIQKQKELQFEQYAIFLHNIRDLIQKNLIVNHRELNTFEKYDFLIT